MADARFPNLDEAFAFLDDARRRVEIELKCSILHDREISEEAVLEAEKGFGSIPGVPNPNHFKVAGHIAFWVRKLKPFRVFRISTVIHFLEERGIQHPFPPEMVRKPVAPVRQRDDCCSGSLWDHQGPWNRSAPKARTGPRPDHVAALPFLLAECDPNHPGRNGVASGWCVKGGHIPSDHPTAHLKPFRHKRGRTAQILLQA
ncbi:hypothetical protein [Azospirillum sp. Sh1]|uniref:hypothetical protein n=1 Tax=Azospirillum sp. Sh1 TaxID=2607285 RepID=UPI0011ECBF8A|nr:hypothetical protein [Azospirillum sp. Sh1]KAA0572751.1 hypothetical protein FZ029_22780 [Azospirillum sp. Sh1]